VVGDLAPEPANPCRHHWLIDPPRGETSRGVCRLCGASRDFLNSPETAFSIAKRGQAVRPERTSS